MPSKDLCAGDVHTGDMPTCSLHSGDMRTGYLRTEDLSAREMRPGNLPARNLLSGTLRTGYLCTKEMSARDMRLCDLHTHGTDAEDLPSGRFSGNGSPYRSNLCFGDLQARHLYSQSRRPRRVYTETSGTQDRAPITPERLRS